MPLTSGGDWSLGLNSLSRDSLSHAELLSPIGYRLRTIYTDVLQEPLPDHLAVIIERLDEEQGRPTRPEDRMAG